MSLAERNSSKGSSWVPGPAAAAPHTLRAAALAPALSQELPLLAAVASRLLRTPWFAVFSALKNLTSDSLSSALT